MKKLFYLALAVSVISCDRQSEKISVNQLTSNNFEMVDGWMGDNTHPSLTKEKAHSGVYAIKVGPGIEYSMGYNNKLSNLSVSKITKIKVRAWVNIPDGNSSSILVTSVEDTDSQPAESLLWTGLKLSDQVKTFNKWVEVEKTITFPPTVNYKHKIKVYLWRTPAQGTALLDDLVIEKVE